MIRIVCDDLLPIKRTKMGDDFVKKGLLALLQGCFDKSQWSFNAALYLKSSNSMLDIQDPSLWQRGLSSYYAGQFEEGKLQFACDMTANGSDVEEIIWHFLCQCRSSGLGEANLNELLPSGAPPIPPMAQVLELFRGCGSSEAVMKAATLSKVDSSKVVKSYNDTNALAYAHFYIGLFEEIHGRFETARHHLQAASDFKNPDYMGSIMKMHASLFLRRYPPWFSVIHPSGSLFPKIAHGGWQLSDSHLMNPVQEKCVPQTIRDLLDVYDAGIHAFDCGDIYTGVEELYGMLIKAHCARGGGRDDISIHTKFVPDLEAIRNHAVDRRYVESVLRRSLNRLGIQSVDLVQLHWWDTSDAGSLEALKALYYFVGKGWVKKIGLTNFDAATTKSFLDANIPIASTQVSTFLGNKHHISHLLFRSYCT